MYPNLWLLQYFYLKAPDSHEERWEERDWKWRIARREKSREWITWWLSHETESKSDRASKMVRGHDTERERERKRERDKLVCTSHQIHLLCFPPAPLCHLPNGWFPSRLRYSVGVCRGVFSMLAVLPQDWSLICFCSITSPVRQSFPSSCSPLPTQTFSPPSVSSFHPCASLLCCFIGMSIHGIMHDDMATFGLKIWIIIAQANRQYLNTCFMENTYSIKASMFITKQGNQTTVQLNLSK